MDTLDYNESHWKQKPCPPDCKKDTCKCGLKKVYLASALGDDSKDSPIAPKNGAYCNAIVVYEANGHIYIYSSEGIPTLVETEGGNVEDIIKKLEDDLAQEVLDRKAGDKTLQDEIDEIKNSPDVVDIVDTYADLQAYDTSHLGDKDIIRVLADETHDGASSYYRWDKQTETWIYIGSIQTAANTIFYADLSETGGTRHIYKNSDMTGAVSVQDLLDANEDGQVILRMSSAQTPENFNDAYLQNTYVGENDYQFLFLDNRNYYEYDGTTTADTTYYYSKSVVQLQLTAGNNITITGNTISATDTTYSDFVGTDGTAAGAAGLVPAPATTDAGKFLKADGTWDTAGSSVNIVQTTGTSTTDVMSQNAVSSTIFADPGTDTKIKIGAGANVSSQSYNMAIGQNSDANGTQATAIGYAAKARPSGVALGASTQAGTSSSHGSCTAIGNSAYVGGTNGTALGASTNVINDYSTAIGNSARARSERSVAIGASAQVDNSPAMAYSVALGANAMTTRAGEVNVGTGTSSVGYNSTTYRVIGGVHDGQNAHDAATVGQLTAYSVVSGAGAPTTSTVAQYIGQFYYDTTNDGYYYCTAITAQGTTPETYSYTWTALNTGGSGPTVVQTTGTSTTDVMSQNATTNMVFADPVSKSKLCIGTGASASSGSGATNVGNYSKTSGNYSIALGMYAWAEAGGAIAIGGGTNTSSSARVYDTNAIAIGRDIELHGVDSIAIGRGAKTNYAKGSVALGSYSGPTAHGEVNIGLPEADATQQAQDGYNGSAYRLLSGLYDGQSAHDAATVAQGNTLATSAPTTSTVGVLGQLYTDTTNMHTYQCTAIDTTDPDNPSYSWTQRW